MEKRNITITIKKAREWYNSGNEALREASLQAFKEQELVFNYRDITTFKKACKALNLDYMLCLINADNIARISEASAAMFRLNIVRKALNLGQDLHFARDPKGSYICCPYIPIISETSAYFKDKLELGKVEIIGKIKSEGKVYYVLGGDNTVNSGEGLGSFLTNFDICSTAANVGFLGCASEEIAQHFGRYFGMLITKAKFGDITDFEVIEDYTQNRHKVNNQR